MNTFRILVVDDQIEIHGFIEKIFENEPFIISSAYNGNEALIKCLEYTFDIILMDHKMPIMNGFEACLRIKRKYPSMPIILMSAYASDLPEKYNILPLVDYIMEKPLSKEKLLRCMHRSLRKKKKDPLALP